MKTNETTRRIYAQAAQAIAANNETPTESNFKIFEEGYTAGHDAGAEETKEVQDDLKREAQAEMLEDQKSWTRRRANDNYDATGDPIEETAAEIFDAGRNQVTAPIITRIREAREKFYKAEGPTEFGTYPEYEDDPEPENLYEAAYETGQIDGYLEGTENERKEICRQLSNTIAEGTYHRSDPNEEIDWEDPDDILRATVTEAHENGKKKGVAEEIERTQRKEKKAEKAAHRDGYKQGFEAGEAAANKREGARKSANAIWNEGATAAEQEKDAEIFSFWEETEGRTPGTSKHNPPETTRDFLNAIWEQGHRTGQQDTAATVYPILEALWFLTSTQHPATAAKTIREFAEAANPDLKGPYGKDQLTRAGQNEAEERLAEALKEAGQF